MVHFLYCIMLHHIALCLTTEEVLEEVDWTDCQQKVNLLKLV